MLSTTYDVHPLKVRKGPFINFCYLVVDRVTRQAAVVDPAWELDKIEEELYRCAARLTTILVTHTHRDHIDLVPELTARYAANVYLSRREQESSQFRCSNIVLVEDQSLLRLGNTVFQALLTPGHTKGSMSYLFHDCLFTGDTVFIEGCGICEDQPGAADALYESFQKIKRIVSPEVRILPGHSYGKMPGYRLSYLLENNIYFLLEEREQFVQFRLRKNQPQLFNFQ